MSFRPRLILALIALAAAADVAGADSPGEPGDPTAAPVQAAGVIRDAGDGLVYARVTRAPAELPAAEQLAGRALILDLRFATDDGTADEPLTTLIRGAAGAKRPLFLLVNAETSPRLRRTVEALDAVTGVITITPVRPALSGDFQVEVTPNEERRAYDAFTTGKTIVELTTDLPEKRRNDEASLTQHPPIDDAPPVDRADDPPAPETATTGRPKPVIDPALQRAVHLYRGLRAMKAV